MSTTHIMIDGRTIVAFRREKTADRNCLNRNDNRERRAGESAYMHTQRTYNVYMCYGVTMDLHNHKTA